MKTNLLSLLLILTINFSFAQFNANCYQNDNGLYQYYARITTIPNIDSDFTKPDFLNYLNTNGNLSAGDLTLLNNNVTSVSKSFPTAQTPALQNVVNIDSNTDIRSIISNSNNAVTDVECRNNPILLNASDIQTKISKVWVAGNPITEKSELKIDSKITNFEIAITNSVGQIIFKRQYFENDNIKLSNLIQKKGIFFIKVTDQTTKEYYLVKVIK